MTTPHPTPEERYEAAVNVATKNWLDHCQLCEHENQQNVESLLHMLQIESVAAIREAEAAGEARGRAMEREQMLPYAPAPTRSPPMTDSAETMREALKEARDTLEALRKQLHGEPFAQNRDRWLNLGMRTVDAIKKADAALSASPPMTDSAEKMREAIKRFYRNGCYHEALDFEVDALVNELAALSASGTKSDGGHGGQPYASTDAVEGASAPNALSGRQEGRTGGVVGATQTPGSSMSSGQTKPITAGQAPGPSDPIPSPSAPPLSAPVRRLKGGCDGNSNI